MVDGICNIIIFDRGLSCNDESADNDECGEKILYYYPDEVTLEDKLARMTLVESLIDFSKKFSKDNIETSVTKRNMYSFCNCEKDIWIIFSYVLESTTHANDGNNNNGYNFHANGSSMIDMMMKMYRIFTTFFGSISNNLNGYYGKNCDGSHFSGVEKSNHALYIETIEEIKVTRKAIRKLNLRQKSNRAAYANTNHRNLDTNTKNSDVDGTLNSIKQIQVEIERVECNYLDAKQRLEVLLASPYYAIGITRELLRRFVNWYVQTGELMNPSAAHSLSGISFLQMGHPTFQALIQVRQAFDIGTGNRNNGSLIIYDGQVIWSDLDEDISFLLYDFVRIIEYQTKRNLLKKELKKVIGDAGGRKVTSDRFTTTDIKITEEHWHEKILARKGFVTNGWDVVDFDDFTVEMTPELIDNPNINKLCAKLDCHHASDTFFSHNSDGLYNIWSPRIHGQKNPPNCKSKHKHNINNINNNEIDLLVGSCGTYCIGRGLVFRQHKFIVVTILPEVSTESCCDTTINSTLHETCGSLQRGLSQSLEKLGRALNEQQMANSDEQRRKSMQIPNGVGLIYYNGCNRALKTANVFRWQAEPFTIWPTSIWEQENAKLCTTILHVATTTSSDDVKQRISNTNYIDVARQKFSTSLILSDGRCKFPLPPPLASVSMEPALSRALNEVRETLSNRHCHGFPVTECCVRVSSQRRGGMWVLARRSRNRHVYVIIEGKLTMHEMYEMFLKTLDTILSQVII